jgi:hypothetical protein
MVKQNQRKRNNNVNGNLSKLQNMERKLAVISSNVPKVERKWSSRNIDFS